MQSLDGVFKNGIYESAGFSRMAWLKKGHCFPGEAGCPADDELLVIVSGFEFEFRRAFPAEHRENPTKESPINIADGSLKEGSTKTK